MLKIILQLVSVASTVYGLLKVTNSVSWGYQAANEFLQQQGGSMDSNQFAIVIQESINTFRWTGIILIICGLLLLITTTQVMKEKRGITHYLEEILTIKQ